jgi:hypothetical protein
MEVEFSEEKLAVACERASKRVTTYITEEIPPYVKEHYAELLDHDLAWRMALESRRLKAEPDTDLEQLFQSACFMKDTESLNVCRFLFYFYFISFFLILLILLVYSCC